jgi:natural product precursor
MKKLGKLKLNALSKHEIKKREMQALKGGEGPCPCGCKYEGNQGDNCPAGGDDYYGGSSVWDNAVATGRL